MLVPAVAYVVCDFESSLIPVSVNETLPKDFHKEGGVLCITDQPITHKTSFHTCVSAFYAFKDKTLNFTEKKTTLEYFGPVIDYNELNLETLPMLREIMPVLTKTNLKIIRQCPFPLSVFFTNRKNAKKRGNERNCFQCGQYEQ